MFVQRCAAAAIDLLAHPGKGFCKVVPRRVLFVTGLMAASVCHGGQLDEASRAKIDRRALEILERTQTPSASIAVIKGGEIAYVRAYGLAQMSPPVKATTATRYQVASLSKEIVAAAALLLQQDGRLSLDDKVAKWLPQLTAADVVTLRQCLTHTAGYPDFWPQDYVPEWMLRPTTTGGILADWGRRPTSFDPGTDWQYSNTGYLVAGRIIELAAGEALFDFVHTRVFEPLGITDAIDVNRTALRSPDALGYIRPALAPPQAQVPAAAGWMFGAWQFALTAEDVAKWDLSILQHTLLSAASYEAEMATFRKKDGTDTGYALGLFVGKRYGRAMISHGGEGAGYLSVNRIFPEDKAAVVVLTNTFSGAPESEIADAIDFIVLAPLGIDSQVLATFDDLQHGRPNRGAFTDDFNRYLDEKTVAAYAHTLGPLGSPTALRQTESENRGGMKAYTYELVAGDRPLSVSVYVTREGKFEQFLIATAQR